MMEARDVLDVIDVLAEEGIEVIIDGGWGIDALLGAQHRDHDDVDLVVPLDHADAVVATLGSVGFSVEVDARPTRLSLVDRPGRAVDLHLVRVDDDGDLWQAVGLPDGSDARYRASEITSGWVGGRTVRCVDAGLQVATTAGTRRGRGTCTT